MLGWVKYKPLYIYLKDRNNYRDIIDECKKKLLETTDIINKIFPNYDFNVLLKELEKYDKDVEIHYQEYLRTNQIWKSLKEKMLAISK